MRTLFRFLKDKTGSATMEFVIWILPFCALLMIMVDVSMMYLDLARMENAARDGARRMAVGQYDTVQQDKDGDGTYETPAIQQVVLSHMRGNGRYFVMTYCSTKETACMRIFRPVTDMFVFGNLWKIFDWDDENAGPHEFESYIFAAQSVMRVEPGVDLTLWELEDEAAIYGIGAE